MKLLLFAHKLEAHAFLAQGPCLKFSNSVTGLYRRKEDFILLTTENPKLINERLQSALLLLHHQISGVINLGIAGSLSQNYLQGRILPVGQFQIQLSMLTPSSIVKTSVKSEILCLTTQARILDQDMANQIKNEYANAALVDKEGYYEASILSNWNPSISFSSYKLVSDLAGHVCHNDVMSKAKQYGQSLFEFYQKNLFIKNK